MVALLRQWELVLVSFVVWPRRVGGDSADTGFSNSLGNAAEFRVVGIVTQSRAGGVARRR